MPAFAGMTGTPDAFIDYSRLAKQESLKYLYITVSDKASDGFKPSDA
jgi:hypothetical protein